MKQRIFNRQALYNTIAIVYLAMIIGFGAIILHGVKVGDSHRAATYYFSSDNRDELIIIPSNVSGLSGYIVNGKVVNSANVSGAETLYRMTQRYKDVRWFWIVLGLFWVIGMYFMPSYVWAGTNYYLRRWIRPLYYKKSEGDKVMLSQAPAGVIAVRKWGMNNKGFLTSINQGKKWTGLTYEDKNPPVRNSDAGIYAFRLGGNHSMWHNGSNRVMGIVCMSGKVVSHADHVLRGQKVTILCLVAKNQKDAKKLRANYLYCPVFVNTNPALAIETWAMSEQGLFWQHHNNELIKEKRTAGLVESIESLEAYKDFGGTG